MHTGMHVKNVLGVKLQRAGFPICDKRLIISYGVEVGSPL
jgi:hypothetical protein